MGVYIAIFSGSLLAVVLAFLPLLMLGKREQARARSRRMAEHRMNARLLRLNL